MTTIAPSQLLQMRNAVLNQNAALQRAAGHAADSAQPAASFGDTMAGALEAVNNRQARASELSAAYERGETSDIVQVMVERQRASLSFEATLQVRNKLLSAYRDIMSMPV